MVRLQTPVLRLGLVGFAALAVAACHVRLGSDGYLTREEKRFTVSGVPDVQLVTFDGAIEVRGSDRQEVTIEIEKRGRNREAVDAIEVAAEQNGDVIVIEARRPRSGDGFLSVRRVYSATLRAFVPRHASVRARTGDGAIMIERVSGRTELRTGDGSIRGFDLAGDVTAVTGDGSVRLEGVQGRVTLTTGDGGMTVAGRLDGVRLRTGDGSISLRVEPGSTMQEPWHIATGRGGVTVYLPGDFACEVDAETSDGVIRSDLSVDIAPRAGAGESRADRRRLRGTLGEGGLPLTIRTGDGSIHLRR